MKVVQRLEIKGRGVVVVLDPDPPRMPKLGSLLKAGSGTYVIRGVEHKMVEPPRGPFGLLTGTDGPQLGEEVELIEAIGLHEAWELGYEAGDSDGRFNADKSWKEEEQITSNPFPRSR